MDALLVRARCFPKEDAEFCAFVSELLADATADLDEVRSAVEARYPRAQLIPQSALAAFSGQPALIYVYRDGSPVANAS